jgi:transposase-like protein
MQEKNVTVEKLERDGLVGDVWTFVAVDAQRKLVLSWMVGDRDAGFATEFLQDVVGACIKSSSTHD